MAHGKGHSSAHSPADVYCSPSPDGWVDQYSLPLGTDVVVVVDAVGPGYIVLARDPAPPGNGAQQLATFKPMSVVAKRSTISATAVL